MACAPHPDHDRGLEFDLATLLSRRRTLGLFLGAGAAAALAACTPAPIGQGGAPASSAAATGGTAAPAATGAGPSPAVTRALAECGTGFPDEAAGPFTADGSNGPNVLEESGVVRRDITSSFGSSSTTVQGVPLEFTLTLLDGANGCRPLAGAAVYAWHCDRDGRYSLYDAGLENENFLRGVQEADGRGRVTFTTVFPGAYNGRWPHIHFEVFESMKNTTGAGRVLKVSQLALPGDACSKVYATAGYGRSRRNFPNTPLAQDGVFGDDGGIRQLAAVSGSPSKGYTASLNVTI